MYQRILLALEHSDADGVLLAHVTRLATLLGSEVLLLHVADGWVARHYDRLDLAESEEMRDDRRYLEETAAHLRQRTELTVEVRLALGDPPEQIVHVAEDAGCDLIAMTSHGHRLLGDLFLGSTITKVRHRTCIPVLAVHRDGSVPLAP